MPTESLLPLAVLVLLLAAAGVGRQFTTSANKRNVLSVVVVALALMTAFFVFYSMGAWFHAHRTPAQP